VDLDFAGSNSNLKDENVKGRVSCEYESATASPKLPKSDMDWSEQDTEGAPVTSAGEPTSHSSLNPVDTDSKYYSDPSSEMSLAPEEALSPSPQPVRKRKHKATDPGNEEDSNSKSCKRQIVSSWIILRIY